MPVSLSQVVIGAFCKKAEQLNLKVRESCKDGKKTEKIATFFCIGSSHLNLVVRGSFKNVKKVVKTCPVLAFPTQCIWREISSAVP